MRCWIGVVIAAAAQLSCLSLAKADELRRLRKASVLLPIDSIDTQPEEPPTGFMDLMEDEFMWRDLLEMSTGSLSFSMSMDMSMSMCSCTDDCLPLDAKPFDIEASWDIGSTGAKGETTRCGPNCYRLKGSGLDMCGVDDSWSSKAPDALHFSFLEINGPFVLASKVCGGPSGDSFEDIAPRTGLMIRESLDPLAQNFFLSHTPDGEANWSARHETDGPTSCDFDGSVDVPCVYLIVERTDSEIIGYYSYEVGFLEGVKMCSQRMTVFEVSFNGTFADEVLIGMAVLYGRQNTLYESEFHEIHLSDDNMFRDLPFVSQYTI